jgi:23S rRNA (pseudouridine1915-N3)-methyltransferase
MKIRVLWSGKTRQPYYRAAIDDYAARIRKMADFEVVETRESSLKDKDHKRRVRTESSQLHAKRKASVCIVLDSSGKEMSSQEFAQWLSQTAGDVDFILGGPAGLEAPVGALKLSLGRMTYPHELARVIVLEQIYRALTILKGIPYHK